MREEGNRYQTPTSGFPELAHPRLSWRQVYGRLVCIPCFDHAKITGSGQFGALGGHFSLHPQLRPFQHAEDTMAGLRMSVVVCATAFLLGKHGIL